MGRLTLNMLLSFAQFEREVTAERIRDSPRATATGSRGSEDAASKKKGLWMGGTVPFGYQPDGRSLKIDEAEAAIIRQIYALYHQLESVRAVAEPTEELGSRTRVRRRPPLPLTGKLFDETGERLPVTSRPASPASLGSIFPSPPCSSIR